MKFQDAANRWNERYQQADSPLFGEAPNAWLAAHAPMLSANSEVLCIADGQGRNGLHLASLGHHVVAFDLSDVAITSLKEQAQRRGLDIDARVSSIDDWEWPEHQYDAVVAIFIQFADPASRAQLLKNAARSLKPGGFFVIEGYGMRQLRYQTGGPGVAENLYHAQLVAESFPQWSVLASRDADVVLAEGRGHAGQSHVISSVIRSPADSSPLAPIESRPRR